MVFSLQENAHFGGPEGPGGGPKTAQQKKKLGPGAAFQPQKEKSPKKWPQDALLNKTKMKTRAKQMKN